MTVKEQVYESIKQINKNENLKCTIKQLTFLLFPSNSTLNVDNKDNLVI